MQRFLQVQRIGYKLKGLYKVAVMALSFTIVNDKANQRAEVLNFWRKHVLAVTMDAYMLSQRTLYRWQALLTKLSAKSFGRIQGFAQTRNLSNNITSQPRWRNW